MSKKMQKWELNLKKKIHEKKIKNAKSTLKNPKAVIVEISDEDPQEFPNELDLLPLLKKFNLQQHYKKLTELGETPQSLIMRSPLEIDEICSLIKLLPGQRSKFNKMIESVMFPNIEYTRNSSICKEKPQTNSTKSTKDRYYPEDALGLCNEKSEDIDNENSKLKEELELALERIKQLEVQLNEPSDSPKIPVKKLNKIWTLFSISWYSP